MSEMKFEKAMFRLEKIVEELERGDLDIDKSQGYYFVTNHRQN